MCDSLTLLQSSRGLQVFRLVVQPQAARLIQFPTDSEPYPAFRAVWHPTDLFVSPRRVQGIIHM